ncbi:hypothetical protein TrLO_g7842 [Triparma laevis f. longispina]|uniref:Uncharacterized protein n=1 Tax=Triparma laevis f. longispina TaxID=1714387 RepID=A0A9W7FMC2_9STRA|nr:hypothetical protein TrLO_g7842 [Triparma laevis f. longispina]
MGFSRTRWQRFLAAAPQHVLANHATTANLFSPNATVMDIEHDEESDEDEDEEDQHKKAKNLHMQTSCGDGKRPPQL